MISTFMNFAGDDLFINSNVQSTEVQPKEYTNE